MSNLRIATCQFPVSGDVESNALSIRQNIVKAAASGATVVHFPETALTGYGDIFYKTREHDYWQKMDGLRREIELLASKMRIWVVVGACRRVDDSKPPANSTYVISDTGRVAAIYDKRKLLDVEEEWYTAGDSGKVVTIAGVRCGFVICYELQFPELFEMYRKDDAQVIFHSCHNVSRSRKPQLRDLTRAQLKKRAIDHSMWISSSNSSNQHSFSRSVIVNPDGTLKGMKVHETGQFIADISVASSSADLQFNQHQRNIPKRQIH